MIDSPLFWFLWGYCDTSTKIFLGVVFVLAVNGACTSAYRLLSYAIDIVANLHGNVTWSIGQVTGLCMYMSRMCPARMPRAQAAAIATHGRVPLQAATLAMPAWPPQVAPRAQGGARLRSPFRGR